MHKAGILPKAIRRFRVTTDSRKTRASPNLIGRDFRPAYSDARWPSDIRTLKTESDMHCDYKSRDDARLSLFDYIEAFYNRQRPPSSIGYEATLPYKTMKSPGRVSPFVGKIGSGHRANSSKAVVGSGERGRTAFGARR